MQPAATGCTLRPMSDSSRTDRTLATDVAVIGASLAGCTTAILLAREGLRVTLVEKHADAGAYKRLCGHYIQRSATPVFERLGIIGAIEAAGGVPGSVDIATPWGVIAPRNEPGHGYSLRRAKLDPLLRTQAIAAPGVTYLGGHAAVALGEGGVVVRDRAGRERAIGARLVVGADGRNSTIVKLAGARTVAKPNHRFCYMAYYEGAERLPNDRAYIWMRDRDVLIASPTDDGLTLVAAFVHKDRLAAFKADRDAAFAELVRACDGGPSLHSARRASPFVGYTDYAPLHRPPVPAPGVALVGDAALTCDPMLAIGCGFAVNSATWLVDATVPALRGDEPLARGLRRYRRRHRRELAGHARMLDAGALAKPPNPIERLMLGAAARDAEMARHFERYATRSVRVRSFLAPPALARAAWVAARTPSASSATISAAGCTARTSPTD